MCAGKIAKYHWRSNWFLILYYVKMLYIYYLFIYIIYIYTGVMPQLEERLPHNRKVDGSSHGRVIPKTLKNGTRCLSLLALEK